MKQTILLVFATFFFSFFCLGQNEVEEFEKKQKEKFLPNVELGLGYLPNPDYNALRFTGAVNNIILWKRVGFYTTFDKGLSSDYFANLIGGSVRIVDWLSVYGGFDFFTKEHGMFYKGLNCRKELGVDVYPWKGLAVRLGYSYQVQFHFGIGWKFSFESIRSKVEKKREVKEIIDRPQK